MYTMYRGLADNIRRLVYSGFSEYFLESNDFPKTSKWKYIKETVQETSWKNEEKEMFPGTMS